MTGEPVGVYVTAHDVCYWRHERAFPFLRMALPAWLSGREPSLVQYYVGEQAAQEIKAFVRELVAKTEV